MPLGGALAQMSGCIHNRQVCSGIAVETFSDVHVRMLPRTIKATFFPTVAPSSAHVAALALE